MKKKRDKLPCVRQKVTIACGSCRKRRSKCTGPPLCLRCKQNGLQCVFITPGNKRGPPKGVPKKSQGKIEQSLEKNYTAESGSETQNFSNILISNSIIPPPEMDVSN
ncbi:7800_t:CDS:2 [Racocetra persica]|uniref:7800_t:CDS:1 n=1 Tax=Racocetra persica TaxID=160502 RepID=A0ACA9LDX7_9GLOM|nr:7800_t:CDS:2 [Racocetra persica]